MTTPGKAAALREVICVAACAGIPTEKLRKIATSSDLLELMSFRKFLEYLGLDPDIARAKLLDAARVEGRLLDHAEAMRGLLGRWLTGTACWCIYQRKDGTDTLIGDRCVPCDTHALLAEMEGGG